MNRRFLSSMGSQQKDTSSTISGMIVHISENIHLMDSDICLIRSNKMRLINTGTRLWEQILSIHYGTMDLNDVAESYRRRYALSKLSITAPEIMKRFK